jgi:hypothetical protein
MMSIAVVKSTECPLVQAAWPKAIDKWVLPNPTTPTTYCPATPV